SGGAVPAVRYLRGAHRSPDSRGGPRGIRPGNGRGRVVVWETDRSFVARQRKRAGDCGDPVALAARPESPGARVAGSGGTRCPARTKRNQPGYATASTVACRCTTTGTVSATSRHARPGRTPAPAADGPRSPGSPPRGHAARA